MTPRRATARLVLLLAAAALAPRPAPAQGTQPAAPAAAPLRAEVIHWWTSGGESAALRVYATAFDQAGGRWVDTAIAGGANARTAAINRVVGGDPPTAMQFNTGKQFDDLVENGLLADVDALAKSENWATTMAPAIRDAVTRDGHAYAVPVDVHGQNWMFYSRGALARAGAAEPTNWVDVFPALDKLRAAGFIPLAFSGQKNWERGLFNTVLAGKGGGAMFAAFWGRRDKALLKTPAFRDVAETFRRLHGYVDQGAPGRNWNDATALVIGGKAGMQVMGDWAKGEFTNAGWTAGQQYGCAVLSDHGTAFLVGGDVFAFPKPKNAETARAQALLERVITNPVNQVAFSARKGSIPPLLNADVASLDECARKAHGWLLDEGAAVPANELLSPPAVTGAVEDVVSQYWNDPSMGTDAFLNRLASALDQV